MPVIAQRTADDSPTADAAPYPTIGRSLPANTKKQRHHHVGPQPGFITAQRLPFGQTVPTLRDDLVYAIGVNRHALGSAGPVETLRRRLQVVARLRLAYHRHSGCIEFEARLGYVLTRTEGAGWCMVLAAPSLGPEPLTRSAHLRRQNQRNSRLATNPAYFSIPRNGCNSAATLIV